MLCVNCCVEEESDGNLEFSHTSVQAQHTSEERLCLDCFTDNKHNILQSLGKEE